MTSNAGVPNAVRSTIGTNHAVDRLGNYEREEFAQNRTTHSVDKVLAESTDFGLGFSLEVRLEWVPQQPIRMANRGQAIRVGAA